MHNLRITLTAFLFFATAAVGTAGSIKGYVYEPDGDLFKDSTVNIVVKDGNGDVLDEDASNTSDGTFPKLQWTNPSGADRSIYVHFTAEGATYTNVLGPLNGASDHTNIRMVVHETAPAVRGKYAKGSYGTGKKKNGKNGKTKTLMKSGTVKGIIYDKDGKVFKVAATVTVYDGADVIGTGTTKAADGSFNVPYDQYDPDLSQTPKLDEGDTIRVEFLYTSGSTVTGQVNDHLLGRQYGGTPIVHTIHAILK